MSSQSSSRLSGFHKQSVTERIARVADFAGLDPGERALLANTGNLPAELANHLVENLVGTMNIPLGVATNLRIDGRDLLVPMATEESSVIAAVCNAARQCYEHGGFTTSMSGTRMIAQIQLVQVPDPEHARVRILERVDQIREICDACDPVLVKLGGGFRELEVRVLDSRSGPMVITHIVVDTRDAMGANAVNTMAEALAPSIAGWTGGRTYLRILSNLADKRLARARCVWPVEAIGGPEVRDGMLLAYHFAEADPYRAATHNKGIMNGIDPVIVATGNDWRAVEAGAHAYACRGGRYTSLTQWERDTRGALVGTIELPMPVGLVGGATKTHPLARIALKILQVQTAQELGEIAAAVGLAQNLGALRALSTEGIQRGHMALHARNIALAAGATGDEIDRVARRMAEEHDVRADRALALLRDIRGN